MKNKKEKTEMKPENILIITPEMMEKTAIEIAKRRAGKKEPQMEGVKNIECPTCRNSTMSYANDLTFDVILTGERIVIPNLTGLKCIKCGEAAFDANATKIIEKIYSDEFTT